MAGSPTGLVEQGNINLNTRPVVRNPDGSISTEKSFSINKDGSEILIPQVVNGRVLSIEQAKQHYLQTGEHLGKFDSPENADAYAEALHNRQSDHYSNPIGVNPAPEGSPQAQNTLRARPLFANEIPAASARPPTLEETVAAALPRFPDHVQVPLDDRDIGTRSFGEAFRQGGVLGALDYSSEQAPTVVAGATKKFLDVVTLPERLLAPDNAAVIDSANNVVSRTLGGFASRENLAMLPLFALAPVRAAIGVQGGIESARGMWDSLSKIAREGPTQANLESLGETGTGALMSALLFKSAFHGLALAQRIGEVPDELLQAAGADAQLEGPAKATVASELKRRGLQPVDAEQITDALVS